MLKSIIIGAKVKLKNNGIYIPSYNNPIVTTEYECDGHIIDKNHFIIKVQWENGKQNIYKHRDVILIDSKYKSIW